MRFGCFCDQPNKKFVPTSSIGFLPSTVMMTGKRDVLDPVRLFCPPLAGTSLSGLTCFYIEKSLLELCPKSDEAFGLGFQLALERPLDMRVVGGLRRTFAPVLDRNLQIALHVK